MNPDSAKPGFEDFYRTNFSRLVNQVQDKKRLRFHDAEDIVQASLAELARQWDTAENPDALLAVIIRRKTIKHWGQQPFTKGITVTLIGEDAEMLHGRAADPAISAEHRDTLRRLAQELHLEPMEQHLVMGRALGLTTAEIADKTKTSAVQVRQVGRRLKQRATAAAIPTPLPPSTVETRLMAHVDRLPARQRQVMSLAIDGYRPVNIAKGLGITANDARVNLSHARKALAAMDTSGRLALDVETLILLRRPIRGGLIPITGFVRPGAKLSDLRNYRSFKLKFPGVPGHGKGASPA